MACLDELRVFGEDLRAIAHDPEILAIDPTGGAWSVGGCWIFAEALRRYFRGKGSLWALNDQALERELRGLPLHVVVRVGGFYFDADGAWDRSSLLGEWKRPWRRLKLVPFDPRVVGTMKCTIRPVKMLVEVFERAFGEPSWLT